MVGTSEHACGGAALERGTRSGAPSAIEANFVIADQYGNNLKALRPSACKPKQAWPNTARVSRPSCPSRSECALSAENGPREPSISGALIRHSAVAALASGIGGTFLNPTLPSAI
ncbi:hypothetical protein SVAN01_04581 [Stagonosporopsis vannaccii]|nr:hypothetical protein SVAN01_04581 [Stagonosporopsis vannaccii]